jgi:hypothetical protein
VIQVLLSLPLLLVLSWTVFQWEDVKLEIILKLFLKSKDTQLAIAKDAFVLSNYKYVLFTDKEMCSLANERVEYDVSKYRKLIAQKAKELYDKGAYFDMSEEITEEDCK